MFRGTDIKKPLWGTQCEVATLRSLRSLVLDGNPCVAALSPAQLRRGCRGCRGCRARSGLGLNSLEIMVKDVKAGRMTADIQGFW